MKGFHNIGNTCYLNAGIQMLFQNHDFVDMILKYDTSDTSDASDASDASNEPVDEITLDEKKSFSSNETKCQPLKVIQEQIKEYYNNNGDVMNIREIKSLIENDKKGNHIFRGYNQNDSVEFVVQFLDYIDTVLKKNKQSVNDIFGINIKSSVKCKELNCLNISETINKYSFLLLDIIPGATDLEDLYRNYKRPERLDGDNMYSCEKCKIKTIASKRYEIVDRSNNLLVWIKRFSDHNGRLLKNGSKIGCPLKWRHNMSLQGCIVHMGGMGGGHYIYIGKNNNKWYKYDDSNISEISKDQAELYASISYMLYYKKEIDSLEKSKDSDNNLE
jgi:ubiquitin C-terminal hydrolase